MRTSYSALETYLKCPQKYKFQEIDKIKAPKSKEAVFGNFLHAVLRYVHSQDPFYPPIEKALEFYKNNWPKESFPDKTEERIFFDEGAKILKNYYKKNDPKTFNVLGLESHFELTIKDKELVHVLAGKIDRVDKIDYNYFEIIDYKTSRRMPSEEKVNHDFQLAIYNLGFLERWPSWRKAKIKLSLYYLKHGEKLSTERTQRELAATKNYILKLIQEIIKKQSEGKNFEPVVSKLCDWCGYRNICPMWKDLYEQEDERIVENINIDDISNKFFKLKNQEYEIAKEIAGIKKLITVYFDKKNIERVFSRDGYYIARTLRKIYTYDFILLKPILERFALLDKVAGIDKIKLNKLLKVLPKDLRRKIQETKKIDREFKVISVGRIKKYGSH